MYNLFSLLPPVSQGILRFPEWLYVRNGMLRNLTSVLRFYRRNPTAVQSEHFLVRLLQSIAVPQSLNLERYYENVDALALHMAMTLKMTSSIYPGMIFDGLFYGEGNNEILIATNESFDFEAADRNWQDLEPIRVLRHPMSDMGFPILDGRHNYGSESGLVVLTINIPMLAIMYRAFRRNEELMTEGTGESQRSVMQFIRMYVLPNMLKSHLDLAIFNRLDNLEKGAPLGEGKFRHPFYLTDYTERIQYVQERILVGLQHISKNFNGILLSVPLVVKDDADQLMAMPSIAPTRQVIWALTIARLNTVSLMFRINKDGPGVRNQSEVNRAQRYALMYKSDHLMRTMLPLELYQQVQKEIDGILESL